MSLTIRVVTSASTGGQSVLSAVRQGIRDRRGWCPELQRIARPSQVARLLRLAPCSVATLVHAMVSAGLVVRTGGATDRRTAVLDLTASGREVLAEWQEVNARILAAARKALPAASRRTLDSSVPALRELTSAVDALADGLQVDSTRAGDEASVKASA